MAMTTTTRWIIPAVAWLPIGLSIGAESISNGLRAYRLGAHIPGLDVSILDVDVSLAGAVLVMAAVAVSICQARAAWVACAPGDKFQRTVAGCFAILFITISVTALRSHIADAEHAKNGDEVTAQEKYDRANAAYKQALADLDPMKDKPDAATVEAQIAEAAKQVDPNIWRRTSKCTDATTTVSINECAPVTAVQGLLKVAQRKAELEAKLPELKEALDKLTRPEVASNADANVSSFWGWLMGLGVVGIATFGAVLFAKVETVPEGSEMVPTIPRSVPKTPPRGGRKTDPRVVNFAVAFRKQHGRKPSGSEIKAYFPELPTSTAYDYAKRA